MDVIEAIHGRRSIRAYEPTPIPRGLIELILLDAAQAPPPMRDMAPWTFNVIEGVERIRAYGATAKQYAQQHYGTKPGWEWADMPDFKVFWDAPVVIVISGPVEDCCRAGQNLMLSAHARGLGSCWVGSPMPWLRTAEARAEIGIPEALTPISVFCLGYPRNIPAAPPRGRTNVIWSSGSKAN